MDAAKHRNDRNETRARTRPSQPGGTASHIGSAPVASPIDAQHTEALIGDDGKLHANATAFLLRLQRTAGNNAVATIVRRSILQQTPPAPRPAPFIAADVIPMWLRSTQGTADCGIRERGTALSPFGERDNSVPLARFVQRAPPPVAAAPSTPTPRETLDKEYESAKTTPDWARAAVLLNGFNDADILTRIAALSAEDGEKLRLATPDWAWRVRSPLLDKAYGAAKLNGEWAKAAELLNAFNDLDIATRVAALSLDDGEKLRLGTPDWAFRVRTPLLDKAFEVAKALNDWGKAAELLNAFNDPDLNARLQRLTKEQLPALTKNSEKMPRVALAATLIMASDPTNTMTGKEMYQTWMKCWVGQHNKAVLDVQRIETQLRTEDPVKYGENKFLFDRGESQSYRLGPEYQEATNRLSTCKNVLQIHEVHDWLETYVDSMGKHVTIQEVNTKALEIAAAKDWFRKYMEPFILLGLGMAMEASAGPRANNPGVSVEGEALGATKGPAPLPGTRIPSAEIRFSQTTVSGTAEIEASMRAKGWDGPPVDVVRMPDSKLTALDNTRVLAASRAGIDVQANVHGYGEALPSEQIGRFTTKQGAPDTWGDAVNLRIGKQSAAYRGKFAQGSQGIGSAD